MPRKKTINPDIIEASKSIDPELFRNSIKANFSDFPDPREEGKVYFPIWYLFLITLSGFLAGCNTISDLATFADMRHQWLIGLLGKIERPASYDTLWYFFARTSPDAFRELLSAWLDKLPEGLKRQVLALDGKRLRGANFLGDQVHLVELFATEQGLTIAQRKVPEKKGEASVLEPILSSVNVQGSIISADALYCNTHVASVIRSNGADYLLALKGNQGTLEKEIINYFDQAHGVSFDGVPVDQHKTEGRKHGREELRYTFVLQDLSWLPQLQKWTDLKSVIEVVSQRVVGDKREYSRRLYLSSASGSAKDFSGWIRSHWAIENNLHWVADVVFREDARTASAGHCAENLGTMTRLGMNLIRLFDPKIGLADARRFGCWDERYIEGLMAKLFIK